MEGLLVYESEFKQIIDASRNNSLTFFVGAGVSALSNAPTWNTLIESICKKMGQKIQKPYSSDDYLRIPQMFYYYINKSETTYYNFLEKHLITSSLLPNVVHRELLKLNPSSFVTTNFDELLEDAAIQYCQSFKSIACDSEVSGINGDRFILKVHGDIKHRNIVFKEEDYLNYSENFKLIETLLKSIFSTNTVVFIGYGLNDYNIKLILNWAKTLLKDNFNKPIFIYTDTKSLGHEDLLYQQSRGLCVIEYEKLGKRFDDYLPRYLSVIEAINKSADLTYEGKTEEESFEVTYELLKPLNLLPALRIRDIVTALSNNVLIHENGVIASPPNETPAIKYFFTLCSLAQDEFDSLADPIKEKFQLILEVFSKANINVILNKHQMINFVEEKSSFVFADPLCLALDYKQMYSFTRKRYKDQYRNYLKAFYLSRLQKYDDAFFLFSQIGNEAFKSKNYLLHYLAEVNRLRLYRIINHLNSIYGCYDMEQINAYAPNNDTEHIFEKLPITFQKQYDFLKDLHSVNLFYKESYQASLDAEKLRKAIDSHSLEFGLTSGEKVTCRINESLHFFLGNHLIVDEFEEYKNTIKQLMTFLLYKYSTQTETLLHNQLFPPIGQGRIAFDDIDFYCFLEFFKGKELVEAFQKYHIQTIEFRNVEAIENAVFNLLEYYEIAIEKSLNNLDVLFLQGQIKTCLTLLRYMEISQPLVNRLCVFILKHEFREILIDDKVRFLDSQVSKRKKHSGITAKVIEDKLLYYIDSHIAALKEKKNFNFFSGSSSISYYNLAYYSTVSDSACPSKKLSRRITQIIKLDLPELMPHIVEYYWTYISAYQQKRVISWIQRKLTEKFRFDLFKMLIMSEAKITSNTIQLLKEYLAATLEKNLKKSEDSGFVMYPQRDPFEELNQVGYWCFIKVLPKNFSEFLGYADSFDFYYLYREFDFHKFQPAWLLGLRRHVLDEISKDATVKEKIRLSIAETLNEVQVEVRDREQLQNILTHYFC